MVECSIADEGRKDGSLRVDGLLEILGRLDVDEADLPDDVAIREPGLGGRTSIADAFDVEPVADILLPVYFLGSVILPFHAEETEPLPDGDMLLLAALRELLLPILGLLEEGHIEPAADPVGRVAAREVGAQLIPAESLLDEELRIPELLAGMSSHMFGVEVVLHWSLLIP